MAVPSSGSLNMSKLAKEKLYDDYNSSSSVQGPIFMSDLVIGGDYSGSGENYYVTNTNSASYPDDVAPHAFSEWYGYDHDATLGQSATIYLYGSSTGLTYQRRVVLNVAGISYETEIYNDSLTPTCSFLSSEKGYIYNRDLLQQPYYARLYEGFVVTLTVTSGESTSWVNGNTTCPLTATGSSSYTFTLQAGDNNIAFTTDVLAPPTGCTSYLIVNNDNFQSVTLSYVNCGGSGASITVFPNNSNLICVAEGSYPIYISGTTNYQIFNQGECFA